MSLKVLYVFIAVATLVQHLKHSNGVPLVDEYVNNQLYLWMESMYRNTSRKDCVWRKPNDGCSQDVSLTLYANNRKEIYNPSDKNWLQNSAWDWRKENVVLIHGYASGNPINILRKAYVTHGGYNIFSIDYGNISRPPCYVSTVNNLPYISRCVSNHLNQLQQSGLYVQQLTCVGHSLGAIICGLLNGYLQFQLNKIIALDPAWPLIFGNLRLSRTDATFVHVLQTNAGYFGDVGSIGHVNVCVNGGLLQPYCSKTNNPNLCSHVRSVCYMSQSLFDDLPLIASKCTTYCPNAGIFKFFRENSTDHTLENINVINNVPLTASGIYCLNDIHPPYCPQFLNGLGDRRCCEFL